MFVDQAVYRWAALDELGASAYSAGALAEGRAAIEKLLGEPSCPPEHRALIAANLEFYVQAGVAGPPAGDGITGT